MHSQSIVEFAAFCAANFALIVGLYFWLERACAKENPYE